MPPEPIFNHDRGNKNDCERNACRRWIAKFRKEHPQLKAIMTENGVSPKAPQIGDLMEHRFHYVLALKEEDHACLSVGVDQENGRLSCGIFYDLKSCERGRADHQC
ncbi:MAG: hypothetical protein GX443_14955 [Deltaproteobacteria bacterium]|nr:hypothetical protein [Deltaproteobacteria bacterium]